MKFLSSNHKNPLAGFLPAVFFCLCIASTGCDGTVTQKLLPFIALDTITVTLPDYPAESHPALSGWLLRTVEDGRQKSIRIEPGARTLDISVPRNKAFPILLQPLTLHSTSTDVMCEAEFFHPAGCIYPYSTSASWNGGFTAQTLFALLTAQGTSDTERAESFCSSFNWERLSAQIRQAESDAVTEGKDYSPWRTDMAQILEVLSSGKFAARYVKQKKSRSVQIRLKQDPNANAQTERLFPRYVPQALPEVKPDEEDFSVNVTATICDDDYTINPENVFLWNGKCVHVFVDKKGLARLATTGLDRYTYTK